jgi:predicted RNA binding protein YcfA (HicA-like mRNA interferase family)
VSRFGSRKARVVFRALLHIGWTVKADKASSHTQLERPGWGEYTWAFHEGDELGPKILSRIAKRTGLTPEDL